MATRKRAALEPALAFLSELWALDHALGSVSKRMHDRLGITAQQRMLIRFIGKYPQTTAGELVSMLHVEKGTLSLALARLEKRGLISRKRDSEDARKTRIVLTARGRALDRPEVGSVEQAVARVLQTTKSREIDLIQTFLRRLVQFLELRDGVPATKTRPRKARLAANGNGRVASRVTVRARQASDAAEDLHRP